MNDETAEIDVSADVTQFFRDAVAAARHAQGFDATHAAESYLIGLLADFARPEPLSNQTLCRPVTFLLDEALQASGQERFDRLRSLGDGVLYVTGFFSDHLQTRGVELRYVSSLGARAYDGASSMLRRAAGATSNQAPDVFRELADNFGMFAALLARVSDVLLANSARSESAVVRLYERWLRTGSSSLASALAARGMVAVRGDGTLH